MQPFDFTLASVRAALPLVLWSAAMAPFCASAANSGNQISAKEWIRTPTVPATSAPANPKVAAATVPIAKSVPASIKTVKAPDSDDAHYRTLLGTHFSYRCHIPYTLPKKDAAVEVCEIDPVTLQIMSWPETEVINIVNGEVSIIEPHGQVRTYVAGDVFVLPQGFKGVWRQSQKLLKVVVRQPLFWKD